MHQFDRFRAVFMKNYLRTAGFFFALSVLCSILYIPGFFYVRNLNQDQILQQHKYTLSQSMPLLDNTIDAVFKASTIYEESFQTLAAALSENQDSTLQLKEVQDILSHYFMSHPLIYEIGMVEGDALLFSRYDIFDRQGTLPSENHLCDDPNYLRQFTGSSFILPQATFDSPAFGRYDALTVGYRVSADKDLYLFAHISCDALFDLFSTTSGKSPYHIALYQGNTLIAENSSTTEADTHRLTIESAQNTSLKITAQISNSYIEKDLAATSRPMIFFLVLVLLIAIAGSCLFAIITAKPLTLAFWELSSSGNLHNNAEKMRTDDALVESIRLLESKNSKAVHTLDSLRLHNQMHTLESAFHKGLLSEEDRAAFHSAYPDFPKQWQCALVQPAAADALAGIGGQTTILRFLKENIPNAIQLPFDDGCLLVLSLDQPCDNKLILDDFCTRFFHYSAVHLSYILGQEYDDPVCLADAAQQLEYTWITSADNRSNTESNTLILSSQRVYTLYAALQSGNEKAVTSILEGSVAEIMPNQDVKTAKYAYWAIIYAFLQIKSEDPRLEYIHLPTFRAHKIPQLFCEDLPRCAKQILDALHLHPDDAALDSEQTLLSFIENNLQNQQLSVSMITDHFHISAPTLQKRMNASTGKTFSAYVEDQRMIKARQILTESELSVIEIAEAVGYTNTNSFYKAYKRYWGEPPRATRRKNTI